MSEEYVTQLDQTKRNAQQGELGQQLAQTKIDGIKANFAQIAENIKNEVEILGRENDMNNADAKAITDPKVQLTALAEIEARAKKYSADIDETFAVESLLNRELKGVDQFDEIADHLRPRQRSDIVRTQRLLAALPEEMELGEWRGRVEAKLDALSKKAPNS